MTFPWERNTIRLYHFYLNGIEAPVRIEAQHKQEARNKLRIIMFQYPHLRNRAVINESVQLPLTNKSIKIVDNVRYVWIEEGGGWCREKTVRPMKIKHCNDL